MAAPRRFQLEDILNRPGTYFNPETEVLLVVDDATAVDPEIFEEDGGDEREWVLLGDDVPIDEARRDEVIERFTVRHGEGPTSAPEGDDFDELDDVEPDADPDEL
jgi:hypothetical protein